jgi:hypothetical protein
MEKHASKIASTHEQARRISAASVIAVGKELKAAWERLAGKGRDGMFRLWIENRCGFAKTSAYKAIAVFERFEKWTHCVHLFDASALYLLSAESCPPKARAEAIRRAENGEDIKHRTAIAIKKEYEPGEGKPEVKANKRKVKIHSSTPVSQRAKIARDEMGENPTQLERCRAVMRARFHSTSTYQAAAQVEASGDAALTEAMDKNILSPRDAASLIGRDREAIDARIKEGGLKAAQKRHKAASSEGKTKAQLLAAMLERTWVDWRGFELSYGINSRSAPKDAAKLEEFRTLSQNVRDTVNRMLNRLDEEVAKCSRKTAERKPF